MSPKKNDKLIGVINDEAFKNKHEENLNGSIKEPRIHGKLTHILGESEEATKSLAFFSIVLSFGCLLLISLFFFHYILVFVFKYGGIWFFKFVSEHKGNS